MSLFNSITDYNYLPIKIVSPKIKVGNINYNTNTIIDVIKSNVESSRILIFPELVLTGASCGDMFYSDDLLNKIPESIEKILLSTKEYSATVIFGAPLLIESKIYNIATIASCGSIIGLVPQGAPNRWFAAGKDLADTHVNINSNIKNILISNKLVLNYSEFFNYNTSCKIGIHIGDISLEEYLFLRDLQVVVHLDSRHYKINNTREELIKQVSLLNNQAIIYINSNSSESSTDGVYGGTLLVSEAGRIVANTSTLQLDTQYLDAEIDLDIIKSLRKNKSSSSAETEKIEVDFCTLSKQNKQGATCNLSRTISKMPFLSEYQSNADIKNNLETYEKILELQALALAKRISHLSMNKIVIGVSGGVDSTLALLAAVRAFELLKLDTKNIIAITMPGFATTNRTKNNAYKLADLLQVTLIEIPINKAVSQHLEDIEHKEINVVYENAQARMRTMILFDYANKIGGLVVGTGDLSEIALGWSTYNGDHISNYNINAGIPKTIAQNMLLNLYKSKIYRPDIRNELEKILCDIVSTPISPELLSESQETEKIIGPYRLHDFFLWYYVKYNLSHSKIRFLSSVAFKDEFTDEEINKYLNIFLSRFVANQYKRSCSTDGPDIFGISLSPRGFFLLPSDISTY